MVNDKRKEYELFYYLSFFLYFIILIAERSISLILSFSKGINIFLNGFYTYTYILVFVSVNRLSNLFILCPVFLMIPLDTALIVLRLKKEINFLILIFLSLSTILFIIGFIYKKMKKV